MTCPHCSKTFLAPEDVSYIQDFGQCSWCEKATLEILDEWMVEFETVHAG